MRKEFVRAAIPIPIGIALGFMGLRFGWVIALAGIALSLIQWHYRYVRPMDPVLKASIDEAMKLEKSDPTTAARILNQAWTDAEAREEQEFADLLRRASRERGAALELRARLRDNLKIWERARRKAEKHALDSPYDADAVKEIDRVTSNRELQLAQVELYLEKFRGQ